MFDDTVCAPATAPVNAPVALIRISGSGSLGAAETLFSRPELISHRKALYGSLVYEGEVLDDIILVFYKGPSSYTGEDMLEIFCHGNILIVRRILDVLGLMNIRLAEPGEFTKRAFLNGKMDLTEAEAIHGIITAKSKWEVNIALDQMHGSLKNAINGLRGKIILLKANIEAGIDFSDEDIEFISFTQAEEAAKEIRKDISSILLRCRMGAKLSEGINITLTGRPNVGKSSILNLMLNRERAIVSDIPGTTRDIISEPLQIAGFPINLFDTAGIGEPADEIERIGVLLTKKNVEEAGIVLVVIDSARGLSDEDRKILTDTRNKKRILLINKVDAASEEHIELIEKEIGAGIRFSAKDGTGLKELEQTIGDMLYDGQVSVKENFLADARIISLLEKGLESADAAIKLIQAKEQSEITAFELQAMIFALNEITGEISPDDILDSVFNRFCIGK